KSGSKFINNDTLMARITPCLENGKTAYVDILEDDEVAFGSTEFFVLRSKEGKSDSKFIYYLSISEEFRKVAIQSMTGTSGRQRAQKDSLLNYELSVPSLKEQKKIGKILSLYDEKVESNNAIISNLEELAQTLFKRWFVDFENTNEEGKPYKSSGGKMVESELGMLPEGWEIVRLSDLMDYQGGSQPPSKEFIDTYQEGYIRLIQIRDYDNDNHLTYIPDTLKLKKCNETDIMIARYGAALGRILFRLEGAYNVALAKVMPKKETYKEFLRCYLNTPYFYGRLNSMGGRSAQSGFNKADIQSFKIGFPKEKQIINDFENKMNKLFQYNLNLQKENKKLKEFRDILLPKLLSGEIELPDDMEVTDDVPIS